MSALKESQCYGLSSSKHRANISVFHVKLTDSAANAIGTFQSAKGRTSHPTICFGENEGNILIPADNQDSVRIFTFTVTSVSQVNPHGRFECVQQKSTRAAEDLSCLGVIQKKITVKATDDSYDKAIQSMAQAEEETRSRGAIVIKHGGRYQGRKVKVQTPTAALSSLTKPKQPPHSLLKNTKKGGGKSTLKSSACTLNRKNSAGEVHLRPLRERVMHLLALKPYKRPELFLRLQRDGLRAADKDELDSVLTEVGQLNSKDNAFILKDSLFMEVQKDWPGYTPGDQQLLKRILVRRLFQPQQNLLSVPEAQVSPLRDTPNSSPAHRSKHSLPEEYTDPLANKKPRISHLSSKAVGDMSRAKQSEQKALLDPTRPGEQKNLLDPRKIVETSCQPLTEAAKRLGPSKTQEEPKVPPKYLEPNTDGPPSPLIVPDLKRHKAGRRKSRHKNKEKEKGRERKKQVEDNASEDPNQISQDYTDTCEILLDSNILQAYDTMDYLLKYTTISNYEQRQSYKMDFNKEYSEYRDLHGRIDSVTQQFMELDAQLKKLHRESRKYKTVHNQIVQEYRKIKKSNPNYSQDKIRGEYLHNKLAHIKKLISEYDQQQ